MSNHCKYPVYPSNWRKVSRKLRRLAGGHCQQCGVETPRLSVHHRGVPYPDGRPGNPSDKHDLRLSNLVVLCPACHGAEDNWRKVRTRKQMRKARKLERVAAHRALCVGTGLVPYVEGQSWTM